MAPKSAALATDSTKKRSLGTGRPKKAASTPAAKAVAEMHLDNEEKLETLFRMCSSYETIISALSERVQTLEAQIEPLSNALEMLASMVTNSKLELDPVDERELEEELRDARRQPPL